MIALCPVCVPGIRQKSYSALFALAKKHGLAFDLASKLGGLFTDLNLYEDQLTVASVATTLAASLSGQLSALATLEKLPPRQAYSAEPLSLDRPVAAAVAAIR